MNRLLIITRWYLPATKSGGTVRSLSALVNGLKNHFEITILTSDRDLGASKPYENIEFDTLLHKNGINIVYLSKLNAKSIKKYIDEINPDLIYINSFFDIMTQSFMLLRMIGKVKSNVVISPRGELAKGSLSIKSTKKRVYLFLYKLFNLSNNIVFHTTSKKDRENVKTMFPANEVVCIQNPKEVNNREYTLPFKEEAHLKMVFISRIVPVKNLLFAIELLTQKRFAGEIIFDIYGSDEDKSYFAKCQQAIKKLPDNVKVTYHGFLEPEKISETLSQYHLFFLPTKGENFGHAIVEAMEVGIIPLISDATPWQNLEKFDAGFSLSLDNTKDFMRAIEKVLQLDNENFVTCSCNVKEYISKAIDNQKTMGEYRTFFNHFSKGEKRDG